MVNPTGGSLRVLHVDDEPDFAEMAAEFLTRQNERIDVETVTGASEALDRLHANEFDCVVSDFDMPGQDGIEFLEVVRGEYPDLPFILYTGKGSEEVASEAISAGVTEYLQKESGTSQYEVLANRIINAVEKHHAQHELQDREERLNLFFEQSPLGVIRWDDEFNFARLNATARDILGYSDDELVGEPWEVVIPEEDREEIGEVVVSNLLADVGGYHSINENVRKDGERIVCEWHNWVVTDEGDEVVAVFSQFQDITDRKEQEEELADLERYNREIVENAPVGLFRLDDQMRITYENDRAEEIVGIPEGEDESPALGKDLRELPSVQDAIAIDALNQLEAGENVSFDTSFESIFGKESYLTGKGVPLFDDGQFDGAIIMVVDITERKETEQILEQLRRNITDVVWMTTPEKDSMDFISDSYEDIMGRTVESLRENPISFVDAIHPDDRDRVSEALEQQQQHPDRYQETYRIIRPNGEQRWIHDRSSGVYENGELTRIVGIASDITERKKREEELRESTRLNKRFKTLIDHTSDIIFVVDETGRISFINSAVEDVLGYAPGELEGTIGFDIIHPDDLTRSQGEFSEVIKDAEYTGNLEFRAKHKDGSNVELEARASNRLDNPNIGGVVVVARPITKRKERERALQRKTERLEEFSTVLSHDLRNPLSVAAGRLKLAIEECDSEHLDDIEQAIARMETLIDDTLSLAQAGEKIGELTDVELSALVEACWQNVDTGSASLATDAEKTIQADESRLAQLLENLIRNAIEHGGGDVTVTVGEVDDGFYVADDGQGIPEDHRMQVFDAGHSTTDGDTGFGLAIVRDIAEAHGWEVSVTSGSVGGARFEFTDVQGE